MPARRGLGGRGNTACLTCCVKLFFCSALSPTVTTFTTVATITCCVKLFFSSALSPASTSATKCPVPVDRGSREDSAS